MAEDPWDVWRRRRMADFPDFFADFEKEFARMQGMINRIMEDAMKHAQGPRRHDPFVYGFTMRVGKDGVPHIQPFGSAFPSGKGAVEGQEMAREPMHDVMEGEKEVSVTVELPGAEKGDVALHVGEEQMTVRVDKGRRYHAVIRLPAKVVPSSAKATFKNGILDVTVQKTKGSDPGHRVAIE